MKKIMFNDLFHLTEAVLNGTKFPQDYDFGRQSPHYICGMSVPPLMMARVAQNVHQQWISKFN